ncbi:MAG: type II secretion system F family protein [Chitinophagales bacterium]
MENLVVGLVFFAALALCMGMGGLLYREKTVVMDRLEKLTGSTGTSYVFEELNDPLGRRLFRPVWEKTTGWARELISPERKSKLQQKLIVAGEPYGLDAEGFVVLKYISLSIMLLLGMAFRSIPLILVLGLTGYLLPDLFLKNCQSSRQDKIIRSLPDILDMLSVSVEAGLGFDAAVQKVVEKNKGPLGMEFQKVLYEIKIGKPRREALKDMADRIEVDDVSTFVGGMVQADQLGVSIANVLRVQADQVRDKRRQRAEEKAQKAPVKILFPLLFFIFPAIFVVLLGPAAIQIMDIFK